MCFQLLRSGIDTFLGTLLRACFLVLEGSVDGLLGA